MFNLRNPSMPTLGLILTGDRSPGVSQLVVAKGLRIGTQY